VMFALCPFATYANRKSVICRKIAHVNLSAESAYFQTVSRIFSINGCMCLVVTFKPTVKRR
jgi:hypothetical protein